MSVRKSANSSGAAAAFFCLLAALLLPVPAFAQADAVAGAFRVEPATLHALGFEWRISGDENRNAQVTVRYRKAGESEWHQGLSLMRLQNEPVLNRGFYQYTAPNMFAGSILDLQPGTDYECAFTLSDPDGVSGKTVQVVTVTTRSVPKAATGGAVYNVYPVGYKGEKQQPAFTGLLAAFYMGADQSDHSNIFPPRVKPGDTILVHAGVYKDARYHYGGMDPKYPALGTPFDGTYYLTQSGTAKKPIVIRAAGDGAVIFDGGGNYNLFNLMAANYVMFDGITVRNTEMAFLLGQKKIAGSSGFTLVHSRIEDVGRGVVDDWAGSRDFYIADNVFIGRHDSKKLLGWWPAEVWSKFKGYPQLINSEYAVKVYGQGHVVTHNAFANWHDGLDIATYGTPSADPDKVPVAIDFTNNDFTNIDDNCIEVDGGAHNIRVMRNRCFNTAAGAISSQPTFGGPAYIVRNITYNGTTGGPLKLFDSGAGILVYQNTFIGGSRLTGPVSNVQFRNNLFLGDGWGQPVLALSTYTNYSSSDYNGFAPVAGDTPAFRWTSPAFARKADYAGKLVARDFATLKDYQAVTGQDRHSVLVGYDIFEKAAMPDKAHPQKLYKPSDFDFRLKPGSAAIDQGEVLPNITDGYTGDAPDLGAYELGQTPPHYGPRAN